MCSYVKTLAILLRLLHIQLFQSEICEKTLILLGFTMTNVRHDTVQKVKFKLSRLSLSVTSA
jgi:hypothetical protein